MFNFPVRRGRPVTCSAAPSPPSSSGRGSVPWWWRSSWWSRHCCSPTAGSPRSATARPQHGDRAGLRRMGAVPAVAQVMPRSSACVVRAAGLACGMTVVLSAMAFSIEWLFGATAPIPFDTRLPAGHGRGARPHRNRRGLLGALVVGAVMAARPDLVAGAHDLNAEEIGDRRPVGAAHSPSAECWWRSCSPWWSASSPSTTPTASGGWLRTRDSSTRRRTRSRAAPSPTSPPAASAALS